RRLVAPAEPSTPPLGEQGERGLNWEFTSIGTVVSRNAPQMPAAKLNRFSRCCPRVVPLLPPSGAAAVASLKPSPGASLFTIVIVAEFGCNARRSAASAIKFL